MYHMMRIHYQVFRVTKPIFDIIMTVKPELYLGEGGGGQNPHNQSSQVTESVLILYQHRNSIGGEESDSHELTEQMKNTVSWPQGLKFLIYNQNNVNKKSIFDTGSFPSIPSGATILNLN